MRLIRVDLPSDLERVALVFLSDLHLGDPLHIGPAADKAVGWIAASPERRAILGGDLLNYATKNSKSDGTKDLTIEEQYRMAQSVLGPILGQVLVALPGNHEFRATRDNQLCPAFALADKLGIPYAADGVYIHLSFGKRSTGGGKQHYTIYATHGWGSGKTSGGKLNNLESMTRRVNADIYLMGHGHDPQQFDWDVLDYDPYHQKNVWRQKIGLMSGAWLDWGGYAERMGYPPAAIRLRYVECAAREKSMAIQTYQKRLRD